MMTRRFVWLLLCVGLLLVGTASAWYDYGWGYRKEFTLNNTGSNLTNYQVMFTVNRSAGSDSGFTVYLNGKCEADYDDIRFVGADGTTAWDYWIESSSSTVATIWVEVPSIPNSTAYGSTKGYIYYSNPEATSVSNGIATFPLFDDFDDGSLNTTIWVGENSYSESGGVITVGSSSTRDDQIYSKINYTVGNYATRMRVKINNMLLTSVWGFWTRPHTSSYDAAVFRAGTSSQYISFTANAGATKIQNLGTSYGNNTYHIWEVIPVSTSSVMFYVDNILVSTITTTCPNDPLNVNIDAYTENAYAYGDWAFVRKYTATEPMVSAWGSEEAVPIIKLYPSFSALPLSGYVPLLVSFTDSSTSENCTINTRQWSFGDGTANSTQQNPQHQYTTSGLYDVILTITNSSFSLTNSTKKTGYINVTVNTDAPNADFTVTETCGNTGETFYFIDFSTGGGLYAWNWSFGDGAYSELRNPTHQYSSNGTYDVNLTVWGAYGVDSLLRSNLITVPCGAATPTPTPTLTTVPTTGPAYTGTIPNKPIVTGTAVPTTSTDEYNNWTWAKTGGFLLDIKNDLLPELFDGVMGFLPFLIIIIGFGAVVVFVEGWIRLMR